MGLFSKSKIKKMQKYAECGINSEQFKLAECYYYGKDVEQDYKQAVRWYVEAARHKYSFKFSKNGTMEEVPDAKYMTAVCYIDGTGVPENLRFASRILHNIILSSERNMDDWEYPINDELLQKTRMKYIEAETMLLRNDNRPGAESYYQYKQKIKENKKAAMELLMDSASKGYEDAIFELAVKCAYNSSLGGDAFERTLSLCGNAAANGSARAYEVLGGMYSRKQIYKEGTKVDNPLFDYRKAAAYYCKAAEKGDSDAALELADAYYDGSELVNGIKDLNRAKELLLPVAKRSFCPGENRNILKAREGLGDILMKSGDYEQAIKCYTKALELPWDDPLVHYDSNICETIGNIYLEELRQTDKAVEWFKHGINHDGNSNCRFALQHIH